MTETTDTPTPATDVASIEVVPVLYFDAGGHGPDELGLAVTNLDMRDPNIPDQLGLQIVQDPERGPLRLLPTGGGFMLDRACAADLHRLLGLWLEAHPDTTQATP